MNVLPANTPRPTLVIDTREQTPLVFTRLGCVEGALRTGDYSFLGAEETFAVERKTIADFAMCCMGSNRDRFQRELHRLRGYRFKRLLVIGTLDELERGEYRSQIKPGSVLATIGAIEARYDVPVVFCATEADAAAQIESWACWYVRELLNTVKPTEKSAAAAKAAAARETEGSAA